MLLEIVKVKEITFKFRGLGLFLFSVILVFSVIFLVVPRARANVKKSKSKCYENMSEIKSGSYLTTK